MKNVLFMLLICMATVQTIVAQDIIVTRQSTRIDAKVMEVSNTEIKYKKQSNPDGPMFIIPTADVATILYANGEVQTFEATQPKEEKKVKDKGNAEKYQRLYRGLEASVDAQMMLYLGNNSTAQFAGGLGVGRRFTEKFYWGLNASYSFGNYGAFLLGTTFRPYFVSPNSKNDYFFDVSGGLIAGDIEAFYFRLMPGLQMPLSDYVDFRVGTGYMGVFGDGGALNALALNASFAFHGSHSNSGKSSNLSPTRTSGLQFTIEPGWCDVFELSLIPSYRINNHLSVGVGVSLPFGYSEPNFYFSHETTAQISDLYVQERGGGTTHYSNLSSQRVDPGYIHEECYADASVFGRVDYRMLTGWFSPVFSLNAGMRGYVFVSSHIINDDDIKLSTPVENIRISTYDYNGGLYFDFNDYKWCMYVTPAAGVSINCLGNLYIDLKCGLDMALVNHHEARKSGNIHFETTDSRNRQYTGDVTITDIIKSHPQLATRFYAAIGLTYNFGLLSKK